jgi:pyruvate formate lyase activating enzyme
MFYEKLPGKLVRCTLCPRLCKIPDGLNGFCRIRKNEAGKLFALSWGRAAAVEINPIEKKPFAQFAPGSSNLSIATVGCNFRCAFCFTPETMITTENGMASLEQVFDSGHVVKWRDGFVSFINERKTLTHEGKFSRILKAYKHMYDGDIIVIKPLCLPELKCTPSHKFMVFDRRDGKFKELPAKALTTEHFLTVPKLISGDRKQIMLDMKKILSRYKVNYKIATRKVTAVVAERIMHLHSLGKTSKQIGTALDLHPTYVRKIIGKLKKEGISRPLSRKNEIVEEHGRIRFKTEKRPCIPRYIPLDVDLATLFGYYCAEGHVTKSKDRCSSHSVIFSFGKHEAQKIQETALLVKRVFGVQPRIFKRRTTITVEIGKISVALLFKMLAGTGSHDKYIPSQILRCKSKSIVHAFLRAYFCGDGYLGKKVLEFVTTSEALAYGTCLLLLKIGILPSFYKFEGESSTVDGRKVVGSPYFRVKIYGKEVIDSFLNRPSSYLSPKNPKYLKSGNFFLLPIRKIFKKPYCGFVYNIEVKGDCHSFLPNFVAVSNCCNFPLAQTWEEIYGEELTPKHLIEMAKKYNLPGMSYTFVEPTVFFEYAYDTARLARKAGLYNTFVTNGYITPEAVKELSKYLDAAVVDFKCSANKKDYRQLSAVHNPETIYDALLAYKKHGIYLEISDLIIPGHGDAPADVRRLCKWIVDNLGPDTPMHFIQFFPAHKMTDVQPTAVTTLERAIDIAKAEGLRYVYIGNVPGHRAESTYCPACSALVIQRFGLRLTRFGLGKDCKCACGETIPIAGKKWVPDHLWR